MDKEQRQTIINEIQNEVCNNLCHYPYIWDSDEYGELMESEHCKSCPLNRLEVLA